MAQETSFLRFASPGEKRLISREDLGFYHTIVVGAVYDFTPCPGVGDPIGSRSILSAFVEPLKRCVSKLPYLMVLAKDTTSETPFYERVPTININDHLSIVNTKNSRRDEQWLEELLETLLDCPNPPNVPPWKVTICPIGRQQYYVLFSYSHAIGDGLVGPVFHRTLLEVWQQQETNQFEPTSVLVVPNITLPEPFDTPGRLPISWSFLLGPLMAVLLPQFVAKWFGVRAHASNVNEGTWTGSNIFFEPKTYRSRLKILTVNADQLRDTIKFSRAHNAKLTAIIHQLIVRALSKCIADDKITNFVSQTAISMRAAVGASNAIWGNYASGHYGLHPRLVGQGPSRQQMWANAASMSNEMAESATRLNDQPLGLLKYAPSVRKWLFKKLGSKRDCSYEVSNCMAFDAGTDVSSQCSISNMILAQPGNVVGAPINFNLVSVKGGSLVCTITWQQGALDVPLGSEDALVDEIRESLKEGFAHIAGLVEKA
ncbi:hypothetical protein PG984_011969 [Apiospora sp. TS-2023a]